jgi:drug/metabolite transporter (DMT)-like permease
VLTLLALGSSAVWGTADFAAGVASKRRPPIAVVGWTQGLAFVGVSIVVLTQLGNVPWSGWPLWSVLAGTCGLLGLSCFYTALSSGTMGVVAPIAALGTIIPVLLGVATGESPHPLAWIGIVVAIVGVFLASGPELTGAVSARPVLLAACAAVGFGFALFCLDRGARSSTLMTLWGMRATSITVFTLLALRLRTVGGVTPREVPTLAIIGCADLLANAMFAMASSRGSVSITAVLGSLYPLATILLARVLLRERLRPIQLAGVACAMVGVGCIAW